METVKSVEEEVQQNVTLEAVEVESLVSTIVIFISLSHMNTSYVIHWIRFMVKFVSTFDTSEILLSLQPRTLLPVRFIWVIAWYVYFFSMIHDMINSIDFCSHCAH